MTPKKSPPKFKYCGLTIILSNPSRFDTVSLLSANGGVLFNNHCLRPEFNTMQCEIRLMEDVTPLLSNTKCLLLLGEAAMHGWLPETNGKTIGELRGSLFYHNGIPSIASFFPQDAADMRAHEQSLNLLSKDYSGVDADSDDDDDDDDGGGAKRHGRTARRNFAFWLRQDVKKVKQILTTGVPTPEPEPIYRIYPPTDEVIRVLTETKGQHLYFDIETDYEEQNIQCFAFSFDGKIVYSVPVLDYNYKPAYSACHRVMAALGVAIKDNTTVAHNGAAFDFLVIAMKYRLAIGKTYDTMLAMHRCFPDVEKSLGHCTSMWTWQKFHKDEDSHGYMSRDQMMARLKYCGKDVFTMFLIHQAITNYARTIPGLTDSIDAVMRCIKPYLITSLQGIRYNKEKVVAKKSENDELMMQYMRCIDMLVGKQGMADAKRVIKGKAKSFPGSNSQCCEYFHNLLGYPVVVRSKKTGKPSLAKKAMFKLRLKHENPVIDYINLYRGVKLETSTPLGFVPFRDDDNKVIDFKSYENNLTQTGSGLRQVTFPNLMA